MTVINLRQRLTRDESGFTLIELLIVLVIIAILLAIAVPSYLVFKDRANQTAANANVRSAVPAVETFYANNTTYVGMTTAALQSIDSGLSSSIAVGTTPALSATAYCIYAAVGGKSAKFVGPGGSVAQGTC
jgi:type IV pilus assembly protein PilA